MAESHVKLREIIIGLLIISGVTSGILIFSGGVFDSYNQNVDQSQLEELNIANKTFEKVKTAKSRAEDIGSGIEAGVFLLSSVWDSLSVILDAFIFLPVISSSAMAIVGAPNWIKAIIVGIPFTYIVYEILSSYLGRTT